MAYDHEEQEQVELLKAWWNKNGNIVIWIAVVALLAFSGWTAFNSYQQKQSLAASALYDEVQRAASLKDNGKVQAAAAAVVEKYAGSSYASLASFVAAKSAFEAGDLKTAKSQLGWVVEKSKSSELKSIARLRLSSIALDEKNFEEGYKLLAGEFPKDFEGDVLDHKADLLVGQDKINDARVAYKSALDKMPEKHAGRQLVQIKLDALGGPLDGASEASPVKK